MKKKILSIALGLVLMAIGTTTYAADKNINSDKKPTPVEKVAKNFGEQFKDAVDPTISTAKNGFIVQSEIDGHKITAAYNKKGNWVYTLNGYSRNNLDKNIIETAMPAYPNYFITGMQKVDQPGKKSVYLVYIEGRKSFKTLTVSNSSVEVLQDIRKA